MIHYFQNITLFIILGTLEALLWHYSANKISPLTARRLHYPLVIIRVLWFAYLWKVTEHDYSSICMLFLCYSFWHLGTMYQVRNWLNKRVYVRGFFDSASNSSTSVFDKYFNLTFQLRLILFIFGTTFYFIWNLWIQ